MGARKEELDPLGVLKDEMKVPGGEEEEWIQDPQHQGPTDNRTRKVMYRVFTEHKANSRAHPSRSLAVG